MERTGTEYYQVQKHINFKSRLEQLVAGDKVEFRGMYCPTSTGTVVRTTPAQLVVELDECPGTTVKVWKGSGLVVGYHSIWANTL